jgi:hypothetical protein
MCGVYDTASAIIAGLALGKTIRSSFAANDGSTHRHLQPKRESLGGFGPRPRRITRAATLLDLNASKVSSTSPSDNHPIVRK